MKLSAILSVSRNMPIAASWVVVLFLASLPAQGTPAAACEPAPAVRAELEKASVASSGRDFDKNVAPFLALRQRHPNDLVVHERYQDAVQRYGIEGHLRKLTDEYQVLSMQHPDEVMYSYLYARSLIGRNTSSAITQMLEIVADHPEFAPAHGSLAEIYFSAAFHDQEREQAEIAQFLALCPGSELQLRPLALPDLSPLVDQAERLLAENGAPDRIVAMAQPPFVIPNGGCNGSVPSIGTASTTSARASVNCKQNTGDSGVSRFAANAVQGGRKRPLRCSR